MATNQNQQDFYREVDQYRHQRGCWVILLLLIFLALIGGLVYWLLPRLNINLFTFGR